MRSIPAVISAVLLSFLTLSAQPQLRKQGAATQLIVKGKPFLVLGGELHNSTPSSLEYMQPVWQRVRDLNMNTVLAGVNWEMIEPREGEFDFTLVDGLIQEARRNNLRLVFLWFASWKNGQSSYMPLWVKRDPKRFPRAQIGEGTKVEVLSTLAEVNWKADAKAFAALMRHIRTVDAGQQTVIMIQVQNEVGILKDSRDRSPLANAAFEQGVPRELMDSLEKHRSELAPELAKRWEGAGSRTSGTWTEVFGPGPETDEIFMAWNYARYLDAVAAAGKAEYKIPMYANAWLDNPNSRPGVWPSGGPVAHVLDIWMAGAPHLDILSPDIYAKNFAERCRDFTRRGNPLFIPEMAQQTGDRNVFYAIGQHDAIGTSPWAVDSIQNPKSSPLSKSYEILGRLAPLILDAQGKGNMTAFLLDKNNPKVTREMGGYELEISLDAIFGRTAETGFGLIISAGPDEFIGAGEGFRVAFKPLTPGPALAGIGSVDEGVYREGKWVNLRRLNGDENDQGRYWRFDLRGPELHIERCIVYRWE